MTAIGIVDAQPQTTNVLKIAAISIGSVVAVGALVAGVTFAEVNSAQSEGTQKENALTAQYLANQNQLSTLLSNLKAQLGLADRNSSKIDQILTDALKARGSGASGATVDHPQLVLSAIKEAYPNLGGLDYDKVMVALNAGQEAYKDDQDKLLDMLRAFDDFRNSGILHKTIVGWAGIPDDSLRAQVGGTSVTGAAAEAKMYAIVLSADATNAYQTGTLPTINTNPTGN